MLVMQKKPALPMRNPDQLEEQRRIAEVAEKEANEAARIAEAAAAAVQSRESGTLCTITTCRSSSC